MRRLTLSNPSVRICGGNFFQQIGFQATYFVGVIGCATYVLGASAWDVSVLVFMINLLLVVGASGSGVVVDRIGPRKTLLVCLAGCFVTGLVGWLAPVCYPVLYFEGAMNGLLFGACSTAFDAYPRFMSSRAEDFKRMNGINSVARCLSVVAGPVLGGAVAAAFPTQCVFSIMALSAIPAAALVWATRETAHPAAASKAGERGSALRELADGVRITFTHDALRFLFVVAFLGFFCYGAFDSLESLFYRDFLHVGTEWMGWLSAFAGVGAAVGAYAMVRFPVERFDMTLLSTSLLVTAVGSMLYVGTCDLGLAIAGQIVTGFGFGAMDPIRNTLLQRECDPAYIGRVTALLRVGLNSAGILPLLVAPFLADAFGVQAVLFGASTATAAVAALFVAVSRRRR